MRKFHVTLHCPFVGLPTTSELSVNSVGGVRRKTSEKHPRCFNKGPPLPGGGDVTVMGKGERERDLCIEIFGKREMISFLLPKMEVWKMIFLVILIGSMLVSFVGAHIVKAKRNVSSLNTKTKICAENAWMLFVPRILKTMLWLFHGWCFYLPW